MSEADGISLKAGVFDSRPTWPQSGLTDSGAAIIYAGERFSGVQVIENRMHRRDCLILSSVHGDYWVEN